MIIKDLIKHKSGIHTRDIRLATYPYQDDEVIVEGILMDKRYHPIFDITGEVKPVGTIHHMGIWLIVKGSPLTIRAAQAEMMEVPMMACRQTLDTMKDIQGLEIKSGFSNKIRHIMGGRKGCTHLCHLLTVMGQEIVHGWLTHKRTRPSPVPKTLEDIPEKAYLLNSCRMWIEDGPKIEGIRRAIHAQQEQDI